MEIAWHGGGKIAVGSKLGINTDNLPAVKMMTAERLILTMIMTSVVLTSVLLTSMIVTSPLCGRRWPRGWTWFGITWNYWTSIIVFDGQLSGRSNQRAILGDCRGGASSHYQIRSCGNMEKLSWYPFVKIPPSAQSLCWELNMASGKLSSVSIGRTAILFLTHPLVGTVEARGGATLLAGVCLVPCRRGRRPPLDGISAAPEARAAPSSVTCRC